MGALTSDQSDCQEDKGQEQLHGLFSVGDKDSSLVHRLRPCGYWCILFFSEITLTKEKSPQVLRRSLTIHAESFTKTQPPTR